ncbi:MAG: hypothetical protein WEA76_00405 [Acidimicrobiia bacterium]
MRSARWDSFSSISRQPASRGVRRLSSSASPLCGLTRGVARFVGDFAASLAFHPLAWIVLAVAVAAWVAWVAWLGRRAGWWAGRVRRIQSWTLALLALGLVTVWIFRAATDSLPPI